jgi:hypothetical protein
MKSENLHYSVLSHLHQSLVQDMERYSMLTGSSVEAVWNGGKRTAPAGMWSCVTAVKLQCARSCTHFAHLCSRTCPRGHILKNFFKALYQTVYKFIVYFVLVIFSQQFNKTWYIFKFIYHATYAVCRPKTEICTLTPLSFKPILPEVAFSPFLQSNEN